MDSGWVKLYRKTLDSAVFQDPYLLQLFWYCVMKANSKDAYISMKTGQGNTLVEVKRGQFITGRKAISKATKQKEGSIRRRLLLLEKLGNVNIKATSHYSIITIVKYGEYQSADKKRTGKRPTTDQPPTTNKKTLVLNIINKEEMFKKFWDKYNIKSDRKKCLSLFKGIDGLDDKLLDKILNAIDMQEKVRESKKNAGEFHPHKKLPKTWLYNECWNDEIEKSAEDRKKDDGKKEDSLINECQHLLVKVKDNESYRFLEFELGQSYGITGKTIKDIERVKTDIETAIKNQNE